MGKCHSGMPQENVMKTSSNNLLPSHEKKFENCFLRNPLDQYLSRLCENSLAIILKQPLTFFKIGVLKNFAIFTRKHLCWSLFLTLQDFQSKFEQLSILCMKRLVLTKWLVVTGAKGKSSTRMIQSRRISTRYLSVYINFVAFNSNKYTFILMKA